MREQQVTLRGDNCRCGECGLLFRRTSTFDAHRYGPYAGRRCYTSIDLSGKGWRQDSGGFWRRPGPANRFPKSREGVTEPTTHAGGFPAVNGHSYFCQSLYFDMQTNEPYQCNCQAPPIPHPAGQERA